MIAEKEGYKTAQGTITHSVHWPTFLGNIIFGGLIGWAIDFASGSAYKLEPEHLTIPMEPEPGAQTSFGQPVLYFERLRDNFGGQTSPLAFEQRMGNFHCTDHDIYY